MLRWNNDLQLLEHFYKDMDEKSESYYTEKEALKAQYEPNIQNIQSLMVDYFTYQIRRSINRNKRYVKNRCPKFRTSVFFLILFLKNIDKAKGTMPNQCDIAMVFILFYVTVFFSFCFG